MGDIAGVKNLIKAGEADICGRGATQRQWTPHGLKAFGLMACGPSALDRG